MNSMITLPLNPPTSFQNPYLFLYYDSSPTFPSFFPPSLSTYLSHPSSSSS